MKYISNITNLSKYKFNAKLLDPPVHLYPGSIVHVELHPSPFIKPPSSHCSPLTLIPSPHIGVQVDFDAMLPPVQVKPVSMVHVELQPSSDTVLPSSHASIGSLIPSPQIAYQDDEPAELVMPSEHGVHEDEPAFE